MTDLTSPPSPIQATAHRELRGSRPIRTGTASPSLSLLGRFCLRYGADVVDVGAAGQRLLAYLGLRRHTTRTVLAGVLWPDASDPRALGSLRTALWKLHRDRQPVVACQQDILSLADTVTVDVGALRDSARQIVQAPGPGTDYAPASATLLATFLGGDLLPGWDEDWVLLERESLRQLRLHALETLAADLTTGGQHALALEAGLECVRMEPLRESAHRVVAAVHLAEHNLAEAVRQYEAFRELLRSELGVEPSATFRAMVRNLGVPTSDCGNSLRPMDM
ncbi:BTAD domain-containing putative transcriptional regulator [Streptomyces sp. NPDC057199]|uniref:AfsR/SARP family transcriptional regulator n=1 Tax=Streptomyces sp. NPDC057199 TaxID=3346047 RepID=UPI0036394B47